MDSMCGSFGLDVSLSRMFTVVPVKRIYTQASMFLVHADHGQSDPMRDRDLLQFVKELLDCSSNTAIVRLFKTVASLF